MGEGDDEKIMTALEIARISSRTVLDCMPVKGRRAGCIDDVYRLKCGDYAHRVDDTWRDIWTDEIIDAPLKGHRALRL